MVLITSFEPFSGGKKNNSMMVAQAVTQKLQKELTINHCQLTTSFDLAAQEIIDCINNLPEAPRVIISIGEGYCNRVSLETRAINLDKSEGLDNSGVSRNNSPIYPEAPEHLGLNINWSAGYCSLPEKLKTFTQPSSDAGRFVCNNTMYHMAFSHHYTPFGFIHVPNHKCKEEQQNTLEVIEIVSHMIKTTAASNLEDIKPYPTDKEQINDTIQKSDNRCEKTFLTELLKTY